MNASGTPDQPAKLHQMSLATWRQALQTLSADYQLYAPVRRWDSTDYELLTPASIPDIVYNTPKPVSPLKIFFLPIKENVVAEPGLSKPLVIIGPPSCDLWALDVLDLFYLQGDFVDPYYKARREQAILIGMDCHSSQEHCHCTSYGVNPYPEKHQDLVISVEGDRVLLEVHSPKGEAFAENLPLAPAEEDLWASVLRKRQAVKFDLFERNKALPDFQETGRLVKKADEHRWKKHSETCVSCGACATACPTCTCFLLIDRPGFEKIRQMDACQYPGFQRVAGGEDPLKERHVRFCNRYMCKYVWKPERYDILSCTGCGRCIEACIGRINKNELFLELAE